MSIEIEEDLKLKKSLEREIAILVNSKTRLQSDVQNLSAENDRYLEEIPKSKKWAEQQMDLANDISVKTTEEKKKLSDTIQVLQDTQKLVEAEQNKLSALRIENKIELGSLVELRKKIEDERDDVKRREVEIGQRVNVAQRMEAKNASDRVNIDKENRLLESHKSEYIKASDELDADIKIYQLRLEKHKKDLELFEANKVEYFNKMEVLKYKLEQAKKLVEDNEVLRKTLSKNITKLEKKLEKK